MFSSEEIYTVHHIINEINIQIQSILDEYKNRGVERSCLRDLELDFSDRFYNQVVQGSYRWEDGTDVYQLSGGHSYAYSTTPVELAQRVSTVASALSAFELGVALSATLPNAGLDFEGAVEYMRAAQGRVDALERQPLVVGFSDRTHYEVPESGGKNGSNNPKITDSKQQFPQFGWVFGPPVSLDPKQKQLRIEQRAQNYTLTADVSVPGWWPRVRFELETAWIDNWDRKLPTDNGYRETNPVRGQLDKDASKEISYETFELRLPLNRADLDGLTEFLARQTVGGNLPFTDISRVVPKYLSLCETEVTFMIEGANLWRSTEAFLNGRRHTKLTVMPDMTGVAATFNVVNLPVLRHSDGNLSSAKLMLWTRDGPSTTEDIDIKVALDEGTKCMRQQEEVLAPELLNATHVIYADSNMSTFTVSVKQGALPSGYHELKLVYQEVRPQPAAWGPTGDTAKAIDKRKMLEQVLVKGKLNEVLAGDISEDKPRKVGVALAHVAYPGAEVAYTPAAGTTVVYKDLAAGSPSLSAPKAIESVSERLTFKLPPDFKEAYPALANGGMLKGTVNGKNISLEGKFTIAENGKTAEGEFEPGLISDDLRKADLGITITFVLNGTTLPAGTVTLKKK